MSHRAADVVVVGAGFTGLTAAAALVEAGLDVLVLEARDTVGGRVASTVNGLGERIDTGGQFLCDDMPALLALARRFDKTLVEAPADGRVTAQPDMSEVDLEATYAGSMGLRDRMNEIDPAGSEADITVAAWLDKQPESAATRSAFRSMIEGLWCQPLGDVPLWYLVDNDRRVTNTVSELQYFLAETMHSLAEDVAHALGDRLRLGQAARHIEATAAGLRVCAEDAAIDARCVVVALPPVMASRLTYTPALPDDMSLALSVWRSGSVIKLRFRYARPFWRESGRSGMVMWRDVHGLFACDVSADDDHAALVVFAGGPLALRWRELGIVAIRQEAVSRLVSALGPEAGDFLDITLRDWSGDRWSGGGYSDIVIDPKARDAEQTIRNGVPPLYFACSETSLSFPGYIEGAIVAGKQVASRIVADLQWAR